MAQFRFNTISRTDIESSVGGSQMLRAIDYDGSGNLFITGVAGSGKTTVSIMRSERLVNLNKKILLVTFQDLLVKSLKNIASDDLAPHISKFHKWYYSKTQAFVNNKDEIEMLEDLKECSKYDEIIIDEGQNFEARFHKTLLQKCLKITIGADNAQKIHDHGLKAEEIKLIIVGKGAIIPIPLQYNYRNTYEIYNFARYFLPFNERANNNLAIDKIPKGKGQMPTVFLVPNGNTQLAQLYILLRDAGDRNIAVLVYGIQEVEAYYKIIADFGIPCSMHHHNNHIGNNIENVIITTFKSAQGLEFQVVIMPDMETAKNEDYKTEEHYYIGCTRAKENLYLITKGSRLPVYFDGFDSSSYKLTNVENMNPPTTKPMEQEPDDEDLPF